MKSKLLIFMLLSIASFIKADIISSPTLVPFEEALEYTDDNSLVIFDVDDVLITCTDPTLQVSNKAQLDKICQTFADQVTNEEYTRLFSIAMKSREVEVIDQKIYELLNYLADRAVSTVALTHTNTGKFGIIDKLEDWRILELGELGINFKKLSPFNSEEQLENLKGPSGSLANIKDGVIFTAQVDKGAVLEEALKHLSSLPNQIVYIDDRMDNLESVGKFCAENHIPYHGFHYTAVQNRNNQYVDEELIKIQVDTLMKESRWITSEEAAESFNDEKF